MPVKACVEKGMPGYQWGDEGKCYTYQKGDLKSEKAAYDKATAQGNAAYANGYQGE
jgi:hypothetical protein